MAGYSEIVPAPAAMYALEDLLNTRGEDSVTSGPCVCVRRPRANTQACEVKHLVIEKGKKPSHKRRKRKQVYSQNIETDVRAPEDTNPPDEEYLRKFTKRLCNLTSTPVILPLFKNFLASVFVCFTFIRCLSFAIEPHHLRTACNYISTDK